MAHNSPTDEELLALPGDERARLAQVLLRSLEGEPTDPGAEAAWWEEVQQRIRDSDSGQTTPLDASESLEAIRYRLRNR